MFEDINQLFERNQPNPSTVKPPSYTLGQMFGDPVVAAYAPPSQPQMGNSLNQMGSKYTIAMPAVSQNPAQDRANVAQTLEQKYGANYMDHPEVQDVLKQMQDSNPINETNEASLTVQGRRILEALRKLGS